MKIFIYFVLFISLVSCGNAKDKDPLLKQKVGKLESVNISKLQAKGLLSELDTKLLPAYLLAKASDDNFKLETMTYSELLDDFKKFKIQIEQKQVSDNNFGSDSVFIRTPQNEKILLGLGEMSLEKLVKRESENLPIEYADVNLNVKIKIPNQISNIIKQLNLDDITACLLGSTVLIKKDLGDDISKYKIGDFLIIANRIKQCKEFQPFLKSLKKNKTK